MDIGAQLWREPHDDRAMGIVTGSLPARCYRIDAENGPITSIEEQPLRRSLAIALAYGASVSGEFGD